jgi:hypothetical protein
LHPDEEEEQARSAKKAEVVWLLAGDSIYTCFNE